VRELKNRLKVMGEVISNKTMVKIVLNGLLLNYELVIQTLTHQAGITFETASASLLIEEH
jgi:hypothetical protein